MKSRMPERARTDPWEPQGSNPLGPPGPELVLFAELDSELHRRAGSDDKLLAAVHAAIGMARAECVAPGRHRRQAERSCFIGDGVVGMVEEVDPGGHRR